MDVAQSPSPTPGPELKCEICNPQGGCDASYEGFTTCIPKDPVAEFSECQNDCECFGDPFPNS